MLLFVADLKLDHRYFWLLLLPSVLPNHLREPSNLGTPRSPRYSYSQRDILTLSRRSFRTINHIVTRMLSN